MTWLLFANQFRLVAVAVEAPSLVKPERRMPAYVLQESPLGSSHQGHLDLKERYHIIHNKTTTNSTDKWANSQYKNRLLSRVGAAILICLKQNLVKNRNLPLFFRGSGLCGQRLNERHLELRSSLLLLVASDRDPESSACWLSCGVEGHDIERVSRPVNPPIPP